MTLPLESLEPLLERARNGRVAVLTGAGISAESGIPTFRGEEGYWTVGAREYHPQEMATLESFRRMPDEVWRWYLYRLGVCRSAEPNPAHHAIVRLEEHYQDRFDLITQNVDGLHLRAGSSQVRTHEVHGNIEFRRCTEESSSLLHPMPADLGTCSREDPLDDDQRAKLRCPSCGGRTRPHVLWFDECYDEGLYRSETAMHAAARCDLLIVIGTSGATTLPIRAASAAREQGAGIIDINPQENPFAELAESHGRGAALRGSACDLVPPLVEVLCR